MSKAKKAPKRKNAYQMPDPLPKGEILETIAKTKWILGPSIGIGGFGEIYSAAEYKDKSVANYPYVIKIEPHENGPLFVEMHFYMRNAKPDDVKSWQSKKKFKTFGMPQYMGSGSHICNGTKYRFLVMERFGKDLWKLFLENNKKFPTATVFKVGIQLLDVLEYIHSRGYVHADIKGSNALLGLSKSTENQVYLVDFGLAAHYTTKEYKPDPKKAHNGTIEYTSRDAHVGVATRRGDLEILGYNLIHWLGVTLPWENRLTDPVAVEKAKIEFMTNVKSSLKQCFKNTKVPDSIEKFMVYVSKMNHDTEPDYENCRSILVSGVEAAGGSLNSSLTFTSTKEKPAKSPKRKSDDQISKSPTKKPKVTKKTTESINEEDDSPKENRKTKKRVAKKTNVKSSESSDTENNNEDVGLTAEMKRVKQKLEEKKKAKAIKPKRKIKSSSSSGENSSKDLFDEDVEKNSDDASNKDVMEEVIPGTPEETQYKVLRTRKRNLKEPVYVDETPPPSRENSINEIDTPAMRVLRRRP